MPEENVLEATEKVNVPPMSWGDMEQPSSVN